MTSDAEGRLRALRQKFVDYRDAPMTRGNKVEIATIRKTLNVVVSELDALLATPEPDDSLLRSIQDALVEVFYDPDPADPDPEVDYQHVDWVGVIQDARRTIDKLKATPEPPAPSLTKQDIADLRWAVSVAFPNVKDVRENLLKLLTDPASEAPTGAQE